MLDFDLNKNCFGCGACRTVCPQNAVRMEQNSEGFFMPVINGALCAHCGLCEKVCPHLSPISAERPLAQSQFFAVYMKDEDERLKSASGAVFPVLAKAIINDGGLICGCVWNEQMEAIHILTNKWTDVEKMRGSKYTQSHIGDCYRKIKLSLNGGKKVLFSGTPCQVGGLLSFTGRNANLYTCAVICAGTPSPKVWGKYVRYLEQKNQSRLTDAKFRTKGKLGWKTPSINYRFENGNESIKLVYSSDEYMSGTAIYIRSSCNNCKYKNDGHVSDLIIGDFWGAPDELIQRSQNKGISAVVVNTQQGESLFSGCKSFFFSYPMEVNDVTKGNPMLIKSALVSAKRQSFFNHIDDLPIQQNIRAAIGNNSAKKSFMWLLYRTGLLNKVKTLIGR